MSPVVADIGASVLCGLCMALDVARFVCATPVEAGHRMTLDGFLTILSPAACAGGIKVQMDSCLS